MVLYLIRAIDEADFDDDGSPLWWSNEGGWSTLDYALVWTEEERRSGLNLPMSGEWVKFAEVPMS